MRFSPTRTQSVAVLVTCTVAIILVVAFVRYLLVALRSFPSVQLRSGWTAIVVLN